MIVTEKFSEFLRTHPKHIEPFQKWPLAYFGAVVNYPKQREIIKQWLERQPKITIITGWKRTAKCVSADTEISGRRIDSFGFKKGTAQLYRVGENLKATAEHAVLTPHGWSTIGAIYQLSEDRRTVLQQPPEGSISALSLSEFLSGDLSSWKTVEDFQSDYLEYFHSHGGQPQTEVIFGPDGLPLSNGALSLAYEDRYKYKHTPSQFSDLLSTLGDLHPLHHLSWVEDQENEHNGGGSSLQLRAYKLSAVSEALRAKVFSAFRHPTLSYDSFIYLLLWPKSRIYSVAIPVNIKISKSGYEDYWDAPIPSIHAYSSGGLINHNTTCGAYLGAGWLIGKINHEWPGARQMGIEKTYEWKTRFQNRRSMLIGGRTLDHIEGVLLKQYQDLIPPGYVEKWFSKSHHYCTLYGNNIATVRSYDQDLESWKSGQYQFIHLDEEPPLEILNECLERTRTVKGKILITVAVDDADVSYLPDACHNPLKYFGTEDVMWHRLGVQDVPDEIYPEEEKKIVFQQYDGTPFQQAVREGEFAYVSGRWWPEMHRDIHVIPYFKPPDNWKKWRFIDAGTAAPAAGLWATLHPKGDVFFYREYYKKGTTIRERCEDIIKESGNTRQRNGDMWIEIQSNEQYENDFLDHAEFRKDDHTGDDLSYEYVKEGLNVMPWTTLGQEARREIMRKFLFIDKTKNHFVTKKPGAPRVYIMDNCPNLIWEAEKKAFKKTINERSGVLEKKIQNRDDHLMDCAESAVCELRWLVDDQKTY